MTARLLPSVSLLLLLVAVALLRHWQPPVRQIAPSATLHPEATIPIRQSNGIEKLQVTNGTLQSGNTTSPLLGSTSDPTELRKILRDRTQPSSSRVLAADLLWKHRDSSAESDFAAIVTNTGDPLFLRLQAARALGDSANPDHASLLSQLLGDSGQDPNLRIGALMAIAKIAPLSSLEVLTSAARDANNLVRFKAIQTLERFQGRQVEESLLERLNDPDKYNRARAIRALGNIRSKASLTPIGRILHDTESDDFLRPICLAAIDQILGSTADPVGVQPEGADTAELPTVSDTTPQQPHP